ncbi:MAG TPA: chloride channel protein [Enterovirga sp.]
MNTIEIARSAVVEHGRRLREVPANLRALVRASEFGLVLLAAIVGAMSGVFVTGLSLAAQFLHYVLFQMPPDQRLSGLPELIWQASAMIPAVGGLILAGVTFAVYRWRPRVAVDPIEANALHGGRMSVTDSLFVAAQTLISNGFGASVGLEAGYTQVSGALASRLGRRFVLRRNDMRVLVGAGAAAGIAAAFEAPITGAFYGFELIIGTYSVATVAPVMTATLASTLVARSLGAASFPIELAAKSPAVTGDYLLFIALGFICALTGIAIMRGVTAVEQLFRVARVPVLMRPAVGGALVGVLALVTPQVLSAGHGALHLNLANPAPLGEVAAIIGLKALAAALSLGSGFRGGLFFASLFLGALIGRLFAGLLVLAAPGLGLDPAVTAIVGMTALAVAIIGGPLTMTFLALETSGDLVMTGIVLAAAIVSSITVRELFGYSFSTWRLHLRGETIRSAHDVGWIRSLTAGRMMRSDVRTVRDDMPLAEFRKHFPIGSKQRVVVIDSADRYAGLIEVPDAYAPEEEVGMKASRVSDLVQYRRDFLLPAMNVKDAIAAFDRTESEALAVLDDASNRHVLGILTEGHAMRRYAEELDKVRQGLSGAI